MPRFKRILLKLSGEILAGSKGYGIDEDVLNTLAAEIADVRKAGVEVGVVLGGGNIFRGLAAASRGMDRVAADYMGMLATVINSLALQDALETRGSRTRVLSAIEMERLAEPYIRRRAIRHLEKGRLVIFAAGTGNPFFTTDTTAALRAAEMNCGALAKATQVDGVYSDDPKTNPKAVRYERLTYGEVLARDLKVMDGAAIALARDNALPIVVFSIQEPGNLLKVLRGEARATVIEDRP